MAHSQYSRTWAQDVVTTATKFKLVDYCNSPGDMFLEEYNYILLGPSHNYVSSLYWDSGLSEWYIKNEEGFNILEDVRFYITRTGINETAFAHSATSSNIDAYRTTINHPDLNGNPNAIVVYSHANTVGLANDKTTGLKYMNDKWTIYNQDQSTTMTLGSDYFIVVANNPQFSFKHITGGQNGFAAFAVLDHQALNEKPDARLFVSHDLTESVGAFDKNVGVYYEPTLERWCVVTGDNSPMPNNMAFNVYIPDGDLDNVPDFADRCTGYDDSIDRDQDGNPDYCAGSDIIVDFCDANKTIYEDHLPSEILSYTAEFSITSHRKINSTAQILFYSGAHILNQGFEVAQNATFEAHGTDCDSSGS